MKNFISLGFFLVLIFSSTACNISFQRWQYRSANKLAENKQYKAAVDLYSRVMRRGPTQNLAIEAARSGARFSTYETKDYAKAAEFYNHIVLYSPDSSERLSAQRSLTEIYFEKLLDYDQALVELSHLIPLLPTAERPTYQLMVARSYFNLNNFPQALIEIDDLISKKASQDLKFEALLFKGNLLQAAKRLDDAIKVFMDLRKNYQDRAEAENIGMSLAICYEEKSDLKSAIEVLEDMKKTNKNPDFIQIRINRLKERTANLPGAGGLKR